MKNGFTLMSIVIYVMLFFSFTVFATAISTNLNSKVLSEKGRVVVNENYIKLYTNLLDSAKKSITVDVIESKIVFSNGDIYEYKSDTKEILKNSGKFVGNVENYSVNNIENVIGSSNNINDIDVLKCFSIKVSFKKYGAIITRDILATVGDDFYE